MANKGDSDSDSDSGISVSEIPPLSLQLAASRSNAGFRTYFEILKQGMRWIYRMWCVVKVHKVRSAYTRYTNEV